MRAARSASASVGAVAKAKEFTVAGSCKIDDAAGYAKALRRSAQSRCGRSSSLLDEKVVGEEQHDDADLDAEYNDNGKYGLVESLLSFFATGEEVEGLDAEDAEERQRDSRSEEGRAQLDSHVNVKGILRDICWTKGDDGHDALRARAREEKALSKRVQRARDVENRMRTEAKIACKGSPALSSPKPCEWALPGRCMKTHEDG